MQHLFCFGYGYSASIISEKLLDQGWKISGTCQSEEKVSNLKSHGVVGYLFTEEIPLLFPGDIFKDVTHILISIPPNTNGDPVYINHYNELLKYSDNIKWVGLFSTTGVYGDHQGGWVDESTILNPQNTRSHNRVIAENQWINSKLPINIFRLAGIYGKRSNAIKSIKEGTAKIIIKDNNPIFSRIHVEDIANIVLKSIEKSTKNEIFNCSDDYPCSTLEIMEYAAKLLNVDIPEIIGINDNSLSEMAKSFYNESRKVSNKKIKENLEVSLKYPTYKEGLSAIFNELSL